MEKEEEQEEQSDVQEDFYNDGHSGHIESATLEASAMDDTGKGIVRYNGDTLFVPNLLPGEKGEIEIYYGYNGKPYKAELVKRLTDSPDRVKPICPSFEVCGGCNLMHMKYSLQLLYKQNKVKNLLHKFAKIDMEVEPTIGMNNPYRFRNKIQVPLRRNSKGKIVSGFYKENTHQIVPVDDCFIETENATNLLHGIKKLMDKYRIMPYSEDTGEGLIRYILIKESFHFKETMVVFVTSQPVMYGGVNLAKEIIKEFPQVTTVIQNINTRQTNVILGDRDFVLYGHGKIRDMIFDKTFLISSRSFYQTNPIMTEKLYALALEKAALTGQEEVLDAYSGTGTIGICASSKAKHVTCVEIEAAAVKDAELNARVNKVTNGTFIKDDCTRWIMRNRDHLHFDVVFMDPPRKGSTPEFLSALKKIKPKKIIYISCDPSTLARDLGMLKDMYDINSVSPVDMFPQTSHVETVVSLFAKNSR
jgi:23S rRNA (uracil1939-C5)-methyltransferase